MIPENISEAEGEMTKRIWTVDDLVADLARPIYVLRMAGSGLERKDAMGESCRKRARRARAEIDALVRAYVSETRIP